MNIRTNKISMFSRVPEDHVLIDVRWGHAGLVYGTVKDVARNLGIKIAKKDGYLEFQAPASRMQLFIQRLHFSMVRYYDTAPKIPKAPIAKK